MQLMTLICSFLFSLFAASIICYVALATMLGPWVGPMLALVAVMLLPRLGFSKKQILLSVVAGSMGGIIATAVSFSFPTLYFLQPEYFNSLLAHTHFFMSFIFLLILSAGFFGWALGQYLIDPFIKQDNKAFPVGQLVFTIINSQDNKKQTDGLLAGLTFAILFCLLQVKLFFKQALLPKTVLVSSKLRFYYFSFPALSVDFSTLPLFISLGFIAGSMITFPLFVGIISKIGIVDPLQKIVFYHVSSSDFLFAFCAGIVLSGTLMSLIKIPLQWYYSFKKSHFNFLTFNYQIFKIETMHILFFAALSFLLYWYNFSFISQVYLIAGAGFSVYQITAIAGKIGLAFLGRFATFVMVPGLIIFGYTPLQLTMVVTFVQVAAGVATETLFGYKTAQLGCVDKKELAQFQLFGIVASAISVAFIFYYLVTHFQLGSSQLFAQRAQARALLVNVAHFDYWVLLCGVCFGWFIKKVKVNPTLLLGGLLMPFSLCVPLIVGGMLSSLVTHKNKYEPFCSGVYAGNALTILFSIFL